MRVGLTTDELAAVAWSGATPRYAARSQGLWLLEGETVALVGSGASAVVDGLAASLGDEASVVDGRAAAVAGRLRIHAVQAARLGAAALVVRGPIDAPTAGDRGLAMADLAACAGLGLTAVAEVACPQRAACAADRVAVVRDGRVAAAYPVLAARPREPEDVAHVAERVRRRLAVG